MAVAELHFLSDIVKICERVDSLNLFKQREFLIAMEVPLELEVPVKVIFERPFMSAGDEDDLMDSRGHRFFNDVLDHRFIHDRQHFFRLDFCCRKKAGA